MQPVSIICASPPLLKPTPIRPVCTQAIEAQAAVEPRLPPPYICRELSSDSRPGLLRASTLDGRSLDQVIQAARRASSSERARLTYQTQKKPQGHPTYRSAYSLPRQVPERRESWHSISTDRSSSQSRGDPRRSFDDGVTGQQFAHHYQHDHRPKRFDTPFGPRQDLVV